MTRPSPLASPAPAGGTPGGGTPASPAPSTESAKQPAKTPLVGLDEADLRDDMARSGFPPWRGSQLYHSVYARGGVDFALMSNFSKKLRLWLGEHFDTARPKIISEQISVDGTRKWVLEFADASRVETVAIAHGVRYTLCVSTQVGCTLNCAFCHTGTQRLVRNLSAGEIVSQCLVARDQLGEWCATHRCLTHIVFMGMGEPLYNYDSVARAVSLLTDPGGIGMSRRRVTLSTAGIVPHIGRVGAELDIGLAISLHAVTDELRDRLVPINRKWKLAELLAACRAYASVRKAQRITFEYVMLDGVNDSDTEARQLTRLLRGIPARVNLIAFNPWPHSGFVASSPERVAGFAEIIRRAGLAAPLRAPKGRDIMAACGQLRTASEKTKRNPSAILAV